MKFNVGQAQARKCIEISRNTPIVIFSQFLQYQCRMLCRKRGILGKAEQVEVTSRGFTTFPHINIYEISKKSCF